MFAHLPDCFLQPPLQNNMIRLLWVTTFYENRFFVFAPFFMSPVFEILNCLWFTFACLLPSVDERKTWKRGVQWSMLHKFSIHAADSNRACKKLEMKFSTLIDIRFGMHARSCMLQLTFSEKVFKVTCANNVFIMETCDANIFYSNRHACDSALTWNRFSNLNFQLNKSIKKCQSWKNAVQLFKGIARGMSIVHRRKVLRCVTDLIYDNFLPSSICIFYWFFKCLQL